MEIPTSNLGNVVCRSSENTDDRDWNIIIVYRSSDNTDYRGKMFK